MKIKCLFRTEGNTRQRTS